MKVLVNGCSHIAGTGFSDDDNICRKLTWPNFVKDWQVTNIAMAASSNDSITRRTIDHLENNNLYDMVFVQWSQFDRIELQIPFYKEHDLQKEWFCINSGNAVERCVWLNNNPDLMFEIARSIYLKQFNTDWFENYNVSNILTLQEYLKVRNIRYKFGFGGKGKINFDTPRSRLLDKQKFLDESWVDFCHRNKFKRLPDDAHYEHKAHLEFASMLDELF